MRSRAIQTQAGSITLIEDELRDVFVNRLTLKQEEDAPTHGLLGIKFIDDAAALQEFVEATGGTEARFHELQVYPNRIFHDEHLSLIAFRAGRLSALREPDYRQEPGRRVRARRGRAQQ